jgi:hypothetical protein
MNDVNNDNHGYRMAESCAVCFYHVFQAVLDLRRCTCHHMEVIPAGTCRDFQLDEKWQGLAELMKTPDREFYFEEVEKRMRLER